LLNYKISLGVQQESMGIGRRSNLW